MTGPILKIGNYGTHILHNPAGTFSFVGTVPIDLEDITCTTYDEAVSCFVSWFMSLPVEEQRGFVGDLRNDIFAAVMVA